MRAINRTSGKPDPFLGLLRLDILLEASLLSTLAAISAKDDTANAAGVFLGGVLFGTLQDGRITVRFLRRFPDGLANQLAFQTNHWRDEFQTTLAGFQNEPELQELQLVGWFRASSSIEARLRAEDVQLHRQCFPCLTDLALIVGAPDNEHREAKVYAACPDGTFSLEQHRWTSFRLPPECAPDMAPLEVAMRSQISDDFFLSSYQRMRTLERADRREAWKKLVARSILRLNWFPMSPAPEIVSIPDTKPEADADSDTTSIPSGTFEVASEAESPFHAADPVSATGSAGSKDPPSLPPAIPAAILPEASKVIPAARPVIPRYKVSWFVAATLGILISLLALRFVSHRFSGDLNTGLHSLVSRGPLTDLQLRLQPQDDRVLLTWGHDSFAAQAGSSAVLEIEDGPKSRKLYLDHDQIAFGSVLYRPVSPEVQFRFAIYDGKGASIERTLKFIDATRSSSSPVTTASRP